MVFETPWKIYSEAEIDSHHPSGGESDSSIYISHDRCAVWVRPLMAQSLRLANLEEISELWERLRLVTLLSVLRVVDSKVCYNSLVDPASGTGSK